MIRLISISLGGQAYLNFMGNEFGHPEWIDFPRQGNNFSYHRCRRQWNLKFNKELRYSQLGDFDQVMNYWENIFCVMESSHEYVSVVSETDKLIAYEKGELVFIFNFHPNNSYAEYHVGTNWRSDHMVLFETDEGRFGGHQRLDGAHKQWIKVREEPRDNRKYSFQVYIPSRCAIVLAPFQFAQKYHEVKMPAFDKNDPEFVPFVIEQPVAPSTAAIQ